MQQLSSAAVSRFSKNSFFILAARFVDTISQFITIPIIARYLGVKQYGDYGYVMVFAFIASTFTYTGLERVIMREISKKPQDAGKYLGNALILRWAYMTVIFISAGIAVWFMGLSSEVIYGIYVATFALNLAAETYLYLAVFKAFEKMHYEIYLTMTFQLLYLAAIILITHFNLGFKAFFTGLLLANLIRVALSIAIAKAKFVKPDFRMDLTIIKLLIKESSVLGIYVLLTQLFINCDLFILKLMKSPHEVSLFYAPHNLLFLMTLIPLSLMSGIFPSLSRSAEKDISSLLYKYEKSIKVLLIPSVFLLSLFIVFPQKIIHIIYGSEFIDAAPVFRILAVSIVSTMLFAVSEFTLIALKKQNILLFSSMIALTVRLVLDFILIPSYSYTGAAIAASSGYFVFFLCGMVGVSKYMEISPVLKLIFKPLAAALMLIILGLYVSKQANVYIVSLLGFMLYGICLFGLRFFLPDEINLMKSFTRKAFSIFAR